MEPDKNKIPSWDKFTSYIIDDRGRSINSSLKSNFNAITAYFADKEFNRENFRKFISSLRTTTNFKASNIRKYITTGRLITWCMGLHFLDDYKGAKMDSDTTPLGDLITDDQMKKIAEFGRPMPYIGQKEVESINIKYKCAFTLMRFSGIPPADLCNLEWSHDKGTHFEIHRQKTGKIMLIPIIPQVRTLLDIIPHINSRYVFGSKQGRMKPSTLNDELKKRTALLGLKKHITCYSFRYSMITWCYINSTENTLAKLAKITGHTMNTAHAVYVKYNIKDLTDALYATHPGLIQHQTIDVVKRLAIEFLSKFIDLSAYQIHIEITPKNKDERIIHLS